MKKPVGPLTVNEVAGLIDRHRKAMDEYFRATWLFHGDAVKSFITEMEGYIARIDECDLSTSEVQRKIRYDFNERFIKTNLIPERKRDGSRAIIDYLQSLVDWRDACLRAAIPPDANVTTHTTTNEVHELRLTIKWEGDASITPVELKNTAIMFVNYYKKAANRPHPYSAESISEFSGVKAIHLINQHLRKQKPYRRITVHELVIQEGPLPPPPLPPGTMLIGYRKTYRDQKEPVLLTPARREEHVYIVGRTRSGKTTLLRSLILQDIEAGRGVGLVDPHGDLAQDLIRSIPRDRENDVVFLSQDSPVPINTFRTTSEAERDIIASDVITLFKRQSESWGPRMDAILRFVVATLVRVPNATFLDIYRMLIDPAYREQAVQTADNPAITEFWSLTYPTYPKDATNPISSRLAQFLLSSLLGAILDQPNGVDFFELMGEGKIFIADIAKGKIGEDNMLLLGSLLVSQIQLAAMRRANLPKEERVPFYLYVDEFQNFKTTTFPVILSEASKYGLNLTMAHQHISQLDDETRQSILGNVGTRIFFALGAPDAKFAAPYIGTHEPSALVDFDRGEAIYSPPRTKDSQQLTTHIYEHPGPKASAGAIIENTKRHFASNLSRPGPSTPIADKDPEAGEWPVN